MRNKEGYSRTATSLRECPLFLCLVRKGPWNPRALPFFGLKSRFTWWNWITSDPWGYTISGEMARVHIIRQEESWHHGESQLVRRAPSGLYVL